MAAHTPYGYIIVDGQAVIDKPIAEKLRALFVAFLSCGSMRAAAVKSGIEKTHSVIGRLLKNRIYLGDEYYPQIIDEETFHQVQELRCHNAKVQNRVHEYKKQESALVIGHYKLGKVLVKYDDPYKQAEFAYGLIEEAKNE